MNFIYGITHDNIHFDTWNLYDTSRYLFEDFGHMNLIRQHIYSTNYQISFPPLFITLTYLFNRIINLGVFATVYINFIIAISTVKIIDDIGRQSKKRELALIVEMLLVINPEYMNCLIGGNTVVMGIYIFTLILYVTRNYLLYASLAYDKIFICGLLVGLGLMNRFDFLAVAVIVIVYMVWCAQGVSNKVKIFSFMSLAVLLLCLPWIIYSYHHFDTLFVTDNGRRIINVVDTRPSTFFCEGEQVVTLWSDFLLWIKVKIRVSSVALKSLIKFIYEYSIIREILMFGVFAKIFGFLIKQKEYYIIDIFSLRLYACFFKSVQLF